MNVATRIRIERQIVRRIATDAINLGFTLSVHDGEEFAVRRSASVKAVMAAIMSTDDDTLVLRRPGAPQHAGMIRLVYGNDGWDVINDYTDNADINAVLSSANVMAERLERRWS